MKTYQPNPETIVIAAVTIMCIVGSVTIAVVAVTNQ
jgi:hypothetical protein